MASGAPLRKIVEVVGGKTVEAAVVAVAPAVAVEASAAGAEVGPAAVVQAAEEPEQELAAGSVVVAAEFAAAEESPLAVVAEPPLFVVAEVPPRFPSVEFLLSVESSPPEELVQQPLRQFFPLFEGVLLFLHEHLLFLHVRLSFRGPLSLHHPLF